MMWAGLVAIQALGASLGAVMLGGAFLRVAGLYQLWHSNSSLASRFVHQCAARAVLPLQGPASQAACRTVRGRKVHLCCAIVIMGLKSAFRPEVWPGCSRTVTGKSQTWALRLAFGRPSLRFLWFLCSSPAHRRAWETDFRPESNTEYCCSGLSGGGGQLEAAASPVSSGSMLKSLLDRAVARGGKKHVLPSRTRPRRDFRVEPETTGPAASSSS